ncbi:fructose-1,6-bisphosphatase/inositol monophosphatase family enzyme [Pseudorhizobium tarimense]|uniref:Fructose-1,6-bisphosphatase/inositol monophosphatase family enzyme n=1 Tax=Pseudorhizobium tarimense TaxID=1079109 RepID=A0ABV2H2Q3_9HYPH|nr:inositol monophosphatase family protein [Pseudorhizobium tarimense]MCJ8518184.1 inositol monophosphatase family protein [Pseudorhizobium tarimense]
MSLQLDVSKIADCLRSAAKAEILPRFRRLGNGDVRSKSEPTDLVTEADVAAERYIRNELSTLLPQALFVGEESVAADHALLGRLADAELAVVVDPVDGTFNFASGIPAFGVMASVVWRGETVAGLIYDPMGDDWAIAEKGAGAFLRRPDGEAVRLGVAAPAPLEAMVGMASAGYFFGEMRERVMCNLAKVRMVANYRCAAHEYRTFASGHVHFIMYNKLMPWDHLAGALLAQEAGGYVARFDDAPYLPRHVEGGLLVSTDKESWQMLRREILKI